MMTEAIFKSRRDFLAGAVAAVAAASVPLPAFAAGFRRFASRPLLVVYQEHDAHAAAFASEFDAAGYATLALTDDPVRQWRDGLGRLVRDDNLLLLGLTNWSDYLMLRGLAAEERRYPLFESLHAKGSSVATAREHARALLALAGTQDAHAVLRELNVSVQAPGPSPSLFSWAI